MCDERRSQRPLRGIGDGHRAEERDAGKFHTLDFDFIEALEYGLPPTTGIGPGVERMIMIFTGQENIDDVIVFPMMRPSVSPLNAAIYGLEAPSLAPVEDLVLSLADFEELCREGMLRPHARHVSLKPHLRLWNKGRVSGHVEIEGFLANSVLRLAGWNSQAAEPDGKKKVLERMEKALPEFLRKAFPECEITLSPTTILQSAGESERIG